MLEILLSLKIYAKPALPTSNAQTILYLYLNLLNHE
jgi:hypothetical protein